MARGGNVIGQLPGVWLLLLAPVRNDVHFSNGVLLFDASGAGQQMDRNLFAFGRAWTTMAREETISKSMVAPAR